MLGMLAMSFGRWYEVSIKKTKRVQIRVTPSFKGRLEKVADKLHTDVSDMLALGALLVENQAATPSEYLHLKSEVIAGREV